MIRDPKISEESQIYHVLCVENIYRHLEDLSISGQMLVSTITTPGQMPLSDNERAENEKFVNPESNGGDEYIRVRSELLLNFKGCGRNCK